MRAAVYNRFWHSQGGGERHSGMVASVLTHDGVDVDLIGHTEVDKDELADHLGLDLSRVGLRIVPDKGDLSVAALSAEYDLFVNGSYMSRLAPRSAKAAYLCYFPTPFDVDLPPWKRVLARNVGPLVLAHAGAFDYGTGWFPPEGGRRRQWHWASGDAVLSFPPSDRERVVRLELGGPAMPRPVELTVSTDDGRVLLRTTVGPKFVLHRFTVPPTTDGLEVHFRADTFVPGGTDTRELSVAASGLRLEGAKYGPRQRLAHQYPWLLRAPRDLSFLRHYDTVMANSEYTRGYVEDWWGREADVLFPPIQVQRLHPAPEREKSVVTVGRFFGPGLGHAKRQKEMVEFFAAASRAGRLPGLAHARRRRHGGQPARLRRRRPGGRCRCPRRRHHERPARPGRAAAVHVVGVLVGHRLRRGREGRALGQRALRHDHRRGHGGRLRARRHRPCGAEGDRPRGRRRLPLVHPGAAGRADRRGRGRRRAARPAGRLGLGARAAVQRGRVRRPVARHRGEARAARVRVRAVVVNYDGGTEVLDCLASLTGVDDVVVVDNGSTDGSDVVVERLPGVRLLRSPRNLGYPGLNQALTDLTGVDAVLIVNPDAVLEPGCLEALVQALRDDPGVAAACPRILLTGTYRSLVLHLDGPPRASLDLLAVEGAGQWHLTGPRVRRRWRGGVAWSVGDGSVLRTTSERVRLRVRAHAPGTLTVGGTAHAVGRRARWVEADVRGPAVEVVQNAGSVIGPHGVGQNRGYHRPDGPAFDVAVDVPAWCGAAVLLRADHLREVGLLDPRWFLYYEDTDLAWRGLLRGARYRYVPAARVRHAHSTTIGHGSGLYDVQHHRNRLLTVTKNAPAAEVVAAWRDSAALVVHPAARRRRRPAARPAAARARAHGGAGCAGWRRRRGSPRPCGATAGSCAPARCPTRDLPVLGRWRDPVEEV